MGRFPHSKTHDMVIDYKEVPLHILLNLYQQQIAKEAEDKGVEPFQIEPFIDYHKNMVIFKVVTIEPEVCYNES